MLYLLHRFHHYKPSEIYFMKRGEKQILFSFMRYEIEQRTKENDLERWGY